MNEIHNLSWAHVSNEVKERLEYLRKQNDSVDLNPEQTAALRGEIRALKWLLDLPVAAALKLQMQPPAMPGGEQF